MNIKYKRMTKRKISLVIYSILFILTFSLAIISINHTLFVRADEDAEKKESEEKVTEKYNDYLEEDMENTYEVLGKFNDDIPDGREDSFRYIFSRIIQPGYINDVDDAYIAKEGDKSVLTGSSGSWSACNPSAPANLISSNCTVPNFSAQLGQSVMRGIYPSGVVNGERQSAKPLFSWGVPNDLPGGKVPVDPVQRTTKYTGLEIFGYNASYSSYNGEWDDIMPSTKARLLANYGFMDTINLTGTSIWNGVKIGVSDAIEGFEWNPMTWLGTISNAWAKGSSRSIITIIDSSDANIIATRGWVRSGSSVGSSFYNVYTLTDKQIMDEATLGLAKKLSEMMDKSFNENEELQEILSLADPPKFTYDPNIESEKSKKDREKAIEKNKEIEEYNKEVEIFNKNKPSNEPARKKKDKVPVPDKQFETEEEQFKKWKKTDSRVKKGESKGINCSETETYDDFTTCWASGFENVKNENFNANSDIVAPLIEKAEKDLFKDDPYYDTAIAISHYVCADKDGNPKRNSEGKYEYVYLKENEGGKEFINPACEPIRPVIQGGYFGNGYEKTITDTRHISNVPGASLLNIFPIFDASGGRLQRGFMSISKFNAQLLNEMLNLSFSPLMERLGITKIVKLTITSFKDTIFFPLTATVISIGALLIFWDAIQSRSLMRFFSSLFGIMLVFIIGVFLLNSPDKLVKLFDDFPSKVESSLANIILDDSDTSGLCSTSSKDKNSGIRSAQCNIWSTLVYQPWTYGQFGASHNELNANGFGEGLKNKNTNLVGNAEVNMGGGVTMNNWAAYQMQLMTSGTITERDPKRPPGVTDKNIYRVVDAQAGPNGGALSDGSYFDTWTGSNGTRITTAFEASILSITMLIVIGSFLLLKIQFTFIFSMLFMALPIMLLFGLTPKGKFKLVEYSLTLLSLMIKRLMITVMISVMLVFLNAGIPQGASSYNSVFFASMIIMGLFSMYKKEILGLFNLSPNQESSLMSGNAHEMKEAALSIVPKGVRQSVARTQARMKGRTAGTIGGFMAGVSFANKENLSTLNPKSDKFLTKTPSQAFASLLNTGIDTSKSAREQSSRSYSKRIENKQFREGITSTRTNKIVKEEVRSKGASSIMSGDERLERDLYLEAQKDRKVITRASIDNKSSGKGLIDKNELKDRKTQKELRKAAKKVRKDLGASTVVNDGKLTKEFTNDSIVASELIKEDSNLKDLASRQDKAIDKAITRDKILHPIDPSKREEFYENKDDEVGVSTNSIEYAMKEKPIDLEIEEDDEDLDSDSSSNEDNDDTLEDEIEDIEIDESTDNSESATKSFLDKLKELLNKRKRR